MDQYDSFYVNNIDVLIDAATERGEELFDLDTYNDWIDGRLCTCFGGLVAMLPYFQALGVRAADDGAPVMPDALGRMLGPEETLNHLFGGFGGDYSFETLFMSYGMGKFDRGLLRVASGHKELGLARLYFMRHGLTGEPVRHLVAPGGVRPHD